MTTVTHAAAIGELARLTAAHLTAAGLNVTGPDPDDPAGCRLFIWCPGGPYSLTVDDDAHAELQSDHDDPHRAADTAAALLSPAPSDARHPDAASGSSLTFKGTAGMDLKAKGFDVALDVYTDDTYYDVISEIAVTNPRAGTGTVYITDQGGLTWSRDYWDEHAATAREPRHRTWLPDPPAAPRHIAATITRALSARHGTRAPLQATRGHDHG
ncbi:MAG: hypothetical protein ACRDOI_15930, partial [Trebonia sp.]